MAVGVQHGAGLVFYVVVDVGREGRSDAPVTQSTLGSGMHGSLDWSILLTFSMHADWCAPRRAACTALCPACTSQ